MQKTLTGRRVLNLESLGAKVIKTGPNWTFLNTDGLRVEYGKVEGFFNKMARAKGYGWISAVGSRSEGSGRRGTPI